MSRRDLWLSLRVRILAVLALVLGLALCGLGVLASQFAATAARQAFDRILIGSTIQMAENIYVQGGTVALEPPVAAIATLSAYDLVFYKLVDPRGVVVAGYDDLVAKADPAATRAGVVLEDGRYQGQPVRIASVSRRLMGDQGGWATIVVAQTIEARRALARSMTLKALALVGGMSVLSLAATALAVRFVLAPLTRVEAEIGLRRADDLRPMATAAPHEIRGLVRAIDGFMQRLSQHLAVMQRFIADAAHQIRTPLAALDAQIEILSHMPLSVEAEDTAHAIRERVFELSRLTSQVLDHAMVIHRASTAAFVPVDINALVQSLLATTVPLDLGREVEVAFHPDRAAPLVAGDPASLREALKNVVTNAFAHGAQSLLAVEIASTAEAASIEVCDDGEGMPLPATNLIEPFVKGAASRGSGLGLAITADVVASHSGTLSFRRENGLTKVTITLPLSRHKDQTV